MPARTRKPKTQAKPAYSVVVAEATISPGEAIPRRFSANVQVSQLVARCVTQSLALCVNMNVMACAAQRMRLLRPARTGAKSIWRGQKLGRKAMRYAKGDGMLRPSAKALGYAMDSDDIEEVTEHPFIDLMRRPDPFISGQDWIISVYWALEAPGAKHIYTGERDNSGRVVSLYHLYPQWSRIQPSRTDLFDGIWYGRSRTDEFFVPREEVWYSRRLPDPLDPLGGTSWPRQVILSSDAENAALAAAVARWNNGGTPGLVLKMPEGTQPDQVTQARANLNSQIRGVARTGAPLILVNAEIVPLGWNPKDMQGIEEAKNAFDAIRSAAGIPESMFKMGTSSLASAWRADPQYMGETVKPRIDKFADEMTDFAHDEGLIPDDHWLGYDCPVAEDDKAIQDSTRADTLAGILTPNESRTVRGYDPAPEPEADQLAVNGVNFGRLNAPPPQPIVQSSDTGTGKPGGGDGGGGGGDAPKSDGGGGTNDAAAGAKAAKPPAPHVHPQLTTKDDRLTNQPKEVARILDELRAKLQPWYEKAMAGGVGDMGAINIEAFIPELRAIMAEYLPKILEAGGLDMTRELGGEVFSARPDAVIYAREEGARLVTQVTDTLRQTLAERVAKGIEEGKTVTAIQHDIKAEAPEFSAARAENIARTETSAASNEGRMIAAKDEGYEYKDFITGGEPCPTCQGVRDANGGPIPIDQDYNVNGVAYKRPPFHPQCACTFIPVSAPKAPAAPES